LAGFLESFLNEFSFDWDESFFFLGEKISKAPIGFGISDIVSLV
jgi:hypothetical protein